MRTLMIIQVNGILNHFIGDLLGGKGTLNDILDFEYADGPLHVGIVLRHAHPSQTGHQAGLSQCSLVGLRGILHPMVRVMDELRMGLGWPLTQRLL